MMLNKTSCKIAFWFSYIFNIFFWHSIRTLQINESSTKFFSWSKYYIILKYSWEKICCSIKNTKFIYQIYCWSFFDIPLTFLIVNLIHLYSNLRNYSPVPNNMRGWNNWRGRLEIVIITNNRRVGRVWKNSVGGFLVLIC